MSGKKLSSNKNLLFKAAIHILEHVCAHTDVISGEHHQDKLFSKLNDKHLNAIMKEASGGGKMCVVTKYMWSYLSK